MHHAQLHPRLWIDGLNRFREASQPIDVRNEDIFHPTVLQFRQHREPELGSFALGNPHAEQLLLSVQIDCQYQIERFIDDTLVLAYIDHETVNIDNRIDQL